MSSNNELFACLWRDPGGGAVRFHFITLEHFCTAPSRHPCNIKELRCNLMTFKFGIHSLPNTAWFKAELKQKSAAVLQLFEIIASLHTPIACTCIVFAVTNHWTNPWSTVPSLQGDGYYAKWISLRSPSGINLQWSAVRSPGRRRGKAVHHIFLRPQHSCHASSTSCFTWRHKKPR